MNVVESAVTITRRARPSDSGRTDASVSPASSAITWPPVNAARSPRWWMRRWPNPGARTATASSVRCWLFVTSIPSAEPSTFSARMTKGRGDFMTASSVGMRSCGCEIGSAVSRMYGSSRTVSIRVRSLTMYGEIQPLSTFTPSTKSTATPGVSDSSMVTTPSGPTRSNASAIAAPMTSSSFAAIVAMCSSCSRPATGRATRRSSSTRHAVASSMPRRSSIGLTPSSSAIMPSRTMAWASSVAVVVPSPVWSLVLLATSRTSCAPMFLNWSDSSISRAIETPSFVIVGAPVRRSSTTLRPLGPSVTFTVFASSSTPAWSSRRASWLKCSRLPIHSLLRGRRVLPDAFRDEDPAALEPPVVEVGHRVVDGVQRIRARVERDLALRGERHEVLQVDVRPDEVADERDLARDDVDRRDVDVLAVADDVVEAAVLDHRDAVLDGALLADEVDDRLRAVAVGELLHRLDVRGALDLDRVVGAELAGELEGRLGRVDDDDLRRRVGLEALDADVAEPARADDDRLRARAKHGDRLLDGVDRGQPGVGERGDRGRLERRVELDDRARAGEQEVGEAAVPVDAGERAVDAVHVVAAPARRAQPARDERMHDHRVADLDVRDAGADLVHPARVLVPGRVGQDDLGLLGPLPLLDVEVRAAEPGGPDLHDDVERPGRLGLVDLVELERLVVLVQSGRVHAAATSSGSWMPYRPASSERQGPPLASGLLRA